jgi:hypothetical protein
MCDQNLVNFVKAVKEIRQDTNISERMKNLKCAEELFKLPEKEFSFILRNIIQNMDIEDKANFFVNAQIIMENITQKEKG